LLSLASCAGSTSKPVKVLPPPMPIIDQHVDPIASALPTELQQVNFNDPVELAVFQARFRFDQGETLYKQGSLKRAKEEFNRAVDLILDTAEDHPNEQRLQRELVDLVARINAMELAALRDGDGLTDETDEHAAIDDLQHVETFPALIDPKFKKAVEDELEQVA